MTGHRVLVAGPLEDGRWQTECLDCTNGQVIHRDRASACQWQYEHTRTTRILLTALHAIRPGHAA